MESRLEAQIAPESVAGSRKHRPLVPRRRPVRFPDRGLRDMPNLCIILCMSRTTINIELSLLRKASELTGVSEKTSLVRLGLEALIARESARRLAALGASERQLAQIPRRRPRSKAA